MGSLLVTAGMLAGAVAFIFVLKRFLKGSRHIPGGKKLLLVRDVLAIGPKRAIYLIGLEHRNLVVGISGDQLTLLSEYSEESEAEAFGGRADRARKSDRRARGRPAGRPGPSKVTTLLAPGCRDLRCHRAATTWPCRRPRRRRPRRLRHTGNTRAFSFASRQDQGRCARRDQQTERIPHKFRQLLEQAAEVEGPGR